MDGLAFVEFPRLVGLGVKTPLRCTPLRIIVPGCLQTQADHTVSVMLDLCFQAFPETKNLFLFYINESLDSGVIMSASVGP